MDYTYEIIEAIEDYYGNDIETIIYILRDLFKYTQDNIYDIEIDELCDKHHICKRCFNPMDFVRWTERRGEDYTFNEEMTDWLCPYCNV